MTIKSNPIAAISDGATVTWTGQLCWLLKDELRELRRKYEGIDHVTDALALVPFDVTFEGERRDPDLPKKLDAEAKGILAWAVQGCLDWQREGLEVPESVKAATARYRNSQDHLGRFLDECCVAEENTYVAARTLRQAHLDWCEAQGEKPWSAKAVGQELTDRGFDTAQIGKQRTRSWLGIGLLSSAEDPSQIDLEQNEGERL